jgi:type I restriction enzyme S subunit
MSPVDRAAGRPVEPHWGASKPRFKPYPEYRESGVEWLGKVPVGWAVKKLWTIASVRLSNVDKKSVEGQVPVRLCNYVDVYYHERIGPGLEFMAATATPEQVQRFSLHAGDVLITKDSESWTDIAVPAVVSVDLPEVLCGYHLAIVRPAPGCDGAFLARAFSAIGPRDQFRVAANGITRFGLGGGSIRSGLFATPISEEQRSIAAFLDWETARIDALVAKKGRLVELLQEKRVAFITHVVTKGLHPNAPMKDSGHEWTGEVPAQWNVLRTKFVARLATGHTPSRQHPEYWVDCTIPWFSLADVWQIRDGLVERVSDTAERISPHGLANSAAELLPEGTVMLSRTASVGFSTIMGTQMATTQDFVNWVPGPAILSDYLLFVFRAMTPEFGRLTMGSTHQTIYMPDVGRFVTPLPPVDEQRGMVEFIRAETARLDALVAKVREAIALLKEYRTALISAAVTGKIDVRGAA